LIGRKPRARGGLVVECLPDGGGCLSHALICPAFLVVEAFVSGYTLVVSR
jgi:hypothetical protein